MKKSLLIIFVLFFISGCTSESKEINNGISFITPIQHSSFSTMTPEVILTKSSTSTFELTKFYKSKPSYRVVTVKTEETKTDFRKLCDEIDADVTWFMKSSPDDQWVAVSCGFKINQTLFVQNLNGKKWEFKLSDFMDTEYGGIFLPITWSSDNRFLYFTYTSGIDAGGNQCFSGLGFQELYRLHLSTGTLVKLFQTPNKYHGYKISFSPTSEYYAMDIGGITLTNLINGEVIRIEATGVMGLTWSPDGRYLIYSVANCGDFFVETSSIFAWDSLTKQSSTLFSSSKLLLLPESWIDDSRLRFEGDDNGWAERPKYIFFEYSLNNNEIIYVDHATRQPK